MSSRWFLSGVLAAAGAFAQQDPAGYAPFIDCTDNPPARTIQTGEVRSPDGRHRAFAQVVQVGCENTSTLFVNGKRVFVQPPGEPNGNANSLRALAWSPDSRWLLVARGLWVYASDFGANDLLLYDVRTGRATKPDVLRAVARKLRRKCVLGLGELHGFDERNRVRFGAFNWFNVGDEEPVTNCLEGEELWLYDPVTRRAARPGE